MKKDELLARIALIGFHEFNPDGNHRSRYDGPKGARYIMRYNFNDRCQSYPYPYLHLMIDFMSSRVAEGYYSCASDGCQQLNTRNPDKVWNWIAEKLYSE
jgi:hypothetical protein